MGDDDSAEVSKVSVKHMEPSTKGSESDADVGSFPVGDSLAGAHPQPVHLDVREPMLATFVVTAYNQEQYVREAVEGALGQTYSPLQIILSDDCSPDATFRIMSEMVREYSGPHEILLNRNAQNLGIGLHVSKTFELSKGEIRIGSAGDDISLPDRTAVLVAEFEKNRNLMGVASDWHNMGPDGSPIAADTDVSRWMEGQSIGRRSSPVEAVREVLLQGTNMLPGMTSAWKVTLLKDLPPMNVGVLFEDVALSCRAHMLGEIAFIDKKLVRYRQHDNAICNVNLDAPLMRQWTLAVKRERSFYRRNYCLLQALDDIRYLRDQGRLHVDGSEEFILREIGQKHAEVEALWEWRKKCIFSRLASILLGKPRPPFPVRQIRNLQHIINWRMLILLRLFRDRVLRRRRKLRT